jgi:haloalkane dehalogenase
MWDLPKAMLSFSWATSLFGLQQIANLQTPSAAGDALDRITRALEHECGACAPRRGTRGDARPGYAPSAAIESPSEDFPFQSHFIDVLGSRMHYVEQGTGAPILLVHGNPTWSYTWRNIIPHLSSLGRCIAPDLIGYGRSDKPDIEYRWRDHVRYLEAFIARMGLRDITLVLHDQGSGLGFHYAMRHEDNVKAIAFFEAFVRPFSWDQFSTPEFREVFRRFRTGGVNGEGWQLLVEQNMFIEQLLPLAAGRPLTDREMQAYREPFVHPSSRVPIWRFARETPIGGEPPDVWEAVSTYSERLQRSALPKLLLYVTPGALLTEEHVDWCRRRIRNLTAVHIGAGSHFVQESSPHEIGREVAAWYRRLRQGRRAETRDG